MSDVWKFCQNWTSRRSVQTNNEKQIELKKASK